MTRREHREEAARWASRAQLALAHAPNNQHMTAEAMVSAALALTHALLAAPAPPAGEEE